MKKKEICTVISQECIANDIYSMWIQTDEIAGAAVPGQFVSLYTGDPSRCCPVPSVSVRLMAPEEDCVWCTGVTGKEHGNGRSSPG